MKLQHLLAEEAVIPDLDSRNREGVLKEMVGFLKRYKKIGKEKDLFEKLIQRENLGSTAIGEGIAIPHCKMKGVKNPIVMLAVSRQGVEFESADGKPSHVFFLVVSPPENPSLNLQVLAAIAHLVRKSDSLLKKILDAPDRRGILAVIREEEERVHE